MSAKTFIAFVIAGSAAAGMGAAPAQERPLGHESAVGPHTEAHAPGQRGPGGPGAGPPPAGVTRPLPGMVPGMAPGNAPRNPAFVQQPGGPAPAMPQRGNPSFSPQLNPPRDNAQAAPRFDRPHAPGIAPHVVPGGPIERAPRALGAVPVPYRGDMHRFVDQDARVWRRGRWHHSHHDGRFGWWWVVGGLWYFYPQPVYPYPDPFIPGEVLYGPDETSPYWYYCQSAGQYYPYVTYCPEGWLAVVPDQ
ncbi:hypothetical protein [Trinickia diaoshuihuensis]|uniref:hypothetical protein n=1 Tax=Trinickia diaoshuihuensis TaxID=2292265 RepID=UPI000E25AB46|nr:hypothetical protein [Trinickia diaoshuihuensis]